MDKITKTIVRNHLSYDWWKYAVGIIGVLLVWNFVYTIATRVPPEKLMEIYLVNDYIEEPEKLEELGNKALVHFPELQQISFYDIPLLVEANEMPKDQGDMALQQKLMVTVAAQQGDIYIFSQKTFDVFAKQGLFLDLEPYITDGTIKIDPSKTYKASIEQEDGTKLEPKVYGISVEGNEVLENAGYNTKGKILGIPAYSKKIPLAIRMVNLMLSGELVK
ncbi:hypothetical protein [Mahella australiensis]|uniref:Uncharacterized protein n=1 Tax=Mahella australiensis (strain DSM 15567 / CIP 107919 / 50-1 BON) TaxID=697281 RepID=F3ZZK9_MAHA5|nr:hypothetical protein [Mahella australiensis]AEE96835.1 hypothetical protein Mahau_1654 [Mahella australiensis 50-1 BON]